MYATNFLILGAVLFAIGVFGVIARKNAVMVLMSIELILNSVNLNLIGFNRILLSGTDPNGVQPGLFGEGQAFALFVIAIAAAEVGVGLAMVLLVYRRSRSISLSELSEMKG